MNAPPHSEEAERGIIGSMLLEPDAVIFMCRERGVNENWFYIPAHRIIYEAIMEVATKGRAVDHFTVSIHLKNLGIIDRVGGPLALDHIIDSGPIPAHASGYLDTLTDCWRRRTAISSAREIERAAHSGEVSIVDSIGTALSGLSDIASPKDHVTTEILIAEHRAMRHKARNGEQVGWPMPWDQLNSLIYGIHEPHNLVVAAQTSTGKTSITMNAVLYFVSKGARVAISENDMSRMDLEKRLVGIMTGINPLTFRTKYWTDEQESRWDAAWRELGRLPIFINDHRMTMDDTEAWAMAQKSRNGIDIFVFDFLQKTKRTKEEWKHSLREVVGDWSCRTCEIGKRLKACTITLSQFSRSGNKEKDQTPPHPTLENLKESGEIENNADVVMLLSKRPGQPVHLFTGKYDVWDIDADVAKNRNGPTGITELCLHIRSQQFMTRAQGDILRDEIGRQADREKDKLVVD